MSNIPSDGNERKRIPVITGVLDYFPLAIAAVAKVSVAGNKQHNGVELPVRWAREKTQDNLIDHLGRHLLDRGTLDTDGVPHTAKLAWCALAVLQLEMEQARKGCVFGVDATQSSIQLNPKWAEIGTPVKHPRKARK